MLNQEQRPPNFLVLHLAFLVQHSAFPMPPTPIQSREGRREHRRRRFRRHGRIAYIRSAYSLPSLATLGNAICGFGAIYVAGLLPDNAGFDYWTRWFAENRFLAAAYLLFLAMVFDALDGRLA